MLITLVKKGTDGRRHYYSIHDRQGGLFSPYTLTIVYGFSAKGGRERAYSFDTRRAMERKLRELLGRRFAAGYVLLYSYSRSSHYRKIIREESRSGSAAQRRRSVGSA